MRNKTNKKKNIHLLLSSLARNSGENANQEQNKILDMILNKFNFSFSEKKDRKLHDIFLKGSLTKPTVDDFLAGNNKKRNTQNITALTFGGSDLPNVKQTREVTEQEDSEYGECITNYVVKFGIKDETCKVEENKHENCLDVVKFSIKDEECMVKEIKQENSDDDVKIDSSERTVEDQIKQEDKEYGECITNDVVKSGIKDEECKVEEIKQENSYDVKVSLKDAECKVEEIKQEISDSDIKIDPYEKRVQGNNSVINDIFEKEAYKKYEKLDNKLKEEIKQEKLTKVSEEYKDNINNLSDKSAEVVPYVNNQRLTDEIDSSSSNLLKRKYENESDSQLSPEQKFLVTKMCLENKPISVSNLAKQWRCSLSTIQNWIEEVRKLLLKSSIDTSQFVKKSVTDSTDKTCDYCNIVCGTRGDFKRHLLGTTHQKTMQKIYKFK